MPNTLQTFLAAATQKSATELVDAFLKLPEDKRAWSPAETSRTAIDQIAECAILNGYTVTLIQTRTWAVDSFETFLKDKAAVLEQGWEKLDTLLKENTVKVAAAISAVPDADLDVEIQMPWAKMTLAEVLSYPYWNLSYHLGQVNYIASILGCLA